MYLSGLSGAFSEDVRLRGEALYRLNAVRLIGGDEDEAELEVADGRRHDLLLHNASGVIHAECTCSQVHEGALCPHIWAALVACDRRGLLRGSRGGAFPWRVVREEELDVSEVYSPRSRPVYSRPPGPDPYAWRGVFSTIKSGKTSHRRQEQPWPSNREILYMIDSATGVGFHEAPCFVIKCYMRDRKRDGSWGQLRPLALTRDQLPMIPGEDSGILVSLLGAPQWGGPGLGDQYALRGPGAARTFLPPICATGRLFDGSAAFTEESRPVGWDAGDEWEFRVTVEKVSGHYTVGGYFQRGEEKISLRQAGPAVEGGLILAAGMIRKVPLAYQDWVTALRDTKAKIPIEHAQALVEELVGKSNLPPIDWPPDLRFEDIRVVPRTRFTISEDVINWRSQSRLYGKLAFDYAGMVLGEDAQESGRLVAGERKFYRRDPAAEAESRQALNELGLKPVQVYYGRDPKRDTEPGQRWEVPRSKLIQIVRDLAAKQWQVLAEGKLFRQAKGMKAKFASSGIDWFELQGGIEFEDQFVPFPALLKAIRKGENTVVLADGSLGFLPEDFIRKYAAMFELGETDGASIRFKKNQATLLDILLAERPEIEVDQIFAQARNRLASFAGVQAAAQPEAFAGELRGYQKEGLGWMHFLNGMGFGGCLADDMGVGKTPQVLALLESRRARREAGEAVAPSLAVVPRSLIYNWMREAARFTPKLRVLDHSGADRDRTLAAISNYDLVLSTYGTLRNDAAEFRNVRFDYVILDEAQAIKNAESESAKAARLLNGDHRLVMTGTPIENHLGELWSLFEFLNPGMLGTSVFANASSALRNPDPETRKLLARALRPFILRRTKEQVAKELPAKIEQTIYCELDTPQRKLYDELREHYRAVLLKKVDQDGLAKSKMHILEALLRLRQCACHPGLVDKERVAEPSAKLDLLVPQLAEVAAEGHKALVFSQFTSLLALLKARLDKEGLVYEYLDGKTKDREARVQRFQTSADCPLFLISLKAGGVGLNLTAADYVFILDPWWNPAVEAQAVDRAHRIGQDKQVFAYRLIATGTVEEKVLDLQASKKELATSIIEGSGEGVLKNLCREDLELLLS
ncbi:MAG: DEAD/DEAH box helicase [Acidobacteria bacterium]|nr:DEAD/DEAH box helicase [Acidobacteriota bacterium]